MQTVCIWKSRESLRKAAGQIENDLIRAKRKVRLHRIMTRILSCCALFCSGLLMAVVFLPEEGHSAGTTAALICCTICLVLCGIFLLLHRPDEVRRPPFWYTRYLMDEKVFQYVQAGKPIMFSRGSDSGLDSPEREAEYALIDFDQRQVFAMARAENGEIYFGAADLEDLRFGWQEEDDAGAVQGS